ncbi:hypothetical protein L218DRAFT_957924 [Marasmius fiardii PR-910]|nr:hypothetical protein L218DRAFT_957924 [Marasmius fiardii PR-910]
MQSAAFIHVLLTVLSIVSRLAILSSDLSDSLLEVKSAAVRLQDIYMTVDTVTTSVNDPLPDSCSNQSSLDSGIPITVRSSHGWPSDTLSQPRDAAQVQKSQIRTTQSQGRLQLKKKRKNEIDDIFNL